VNVKHIIKTEEEQLLLVKHNGWAIQYIDGPSEAVQLAAVKEHSTALKYIENPTEKVRNLHLAFWEL